MTKNFKNILRVLPKVMEIGVTGGPGGGKSTCLSKIDQILTKMGFIVIVGEEIVTRDVYSGIAPWDFDTETYQAMVIDQMLHREKIFRKAAKYLEKKFNKRVVILYDRALMDNLAYMPEEMLEKLLAEHDLSIPLARERYDAVIHLVTPAIGAEDAYTTENNEARKDSIEEARDLDYRTRNAWIGTPDFRIVDNSTGFVEKQDRFFKEVFDILGVPMPLKKARMFRVKMPDMNRFENAEGVTKLEIFQTYLQSKDPSVERRIRQRGANGSYAYFYAEKRMISEGNYEDKERKLSKREYLTLLMEGVKSYRKTRYCFLYENQYFELDVYPDKEGEAILEINLTAGMNEVVVPTWLDVIEEVTGDPKYYGANIAK